MKKLITIVGLMVVLTCSGKVPPIYWGPLQNVTKTIPIILEPLSVAMEGSFWALMLIHGAVNAMEQSLVPLTNYEVGVWTYNLLEDNTFIWADKSYPTRNIQLMTSYFYDPRDKHETWSKRLQFTTIDQWTGEEKTTITWDNTRPAIIDFNYLKVIYTRIALPGTHNTTFKYVATGKTMFYCYRKGGLGYPRPLRVTCYGLGWIPTFTNDTMKKFYMGGYDNSRWILMGPDGLVTWMPDPPSDVTNVEWQRVGETTAFYQFPNVF